MTKAEQLADFLCRYDVPGVRRAHPYAPHLVVPMLYSPYAQHQTTSEKVAEDLLAAAEFRALQLGTWLGTTDGKVITQAVEVVTPPIYRPDLELLVDGLKLAASIQQREGQRIAGLVALGAIAFAGVLALGARPASA